MTQRSLRQHPCQHRAALTPRGRYRHKLGQRLPTWPLTRTSAPRTAPCSRLSTLPTKQQVCRGAPTHRNVAQGERLRCGYSTSLPVIAQCRFLTPTSLRPSRVLSKRTNTTNASSSCCMSGGTSASPSALCTDRLSGARIPKRLPYWHQPSSLSCLSPPTRRYVLCIQSLAPVLDEPSGPGASPPSYSPAPHELHNSLCNPRGHHHPLSLRWPVSFRNTSGVSVKTQVQSSRTAPARARARYRFEHRPWFLTLCVVPRGQYSLVAQSRLGRQWEWSRQAGVAVSLSESRSLSLHVRVLRIRPPALRCLPRQHC